MSLLEPKEVQIKTAKGDERTYIFSKFPAMDGREVLAKYPLSALPKVSEYPVNEQMSLKILSFVGVPLENGAVLPLTTRALINNHVPEAETLIKIEFGMMEYNYSFFANDVISTFLKGFTSNTTAWITKTATDLLAQLLAKAKPPSTN